MLADAFGKNGGLKRMPSQGSAESRLDLRQAEVEVASWTHYNRVFLDLMRDVAAVAAKKRDPEVSFYCIQQFGLGVVGVEFYAKYVEGDAMFLFDPALWQTKAMGDVAYNSIYFIHSLSALAHAAEEFKENFRPRIEALGAMPVDNRIEKILHAARAA